MLVALIPGAGVGQEQELAGEGEWHSLSSELIGGTWKADFTRSGEVVRGTLELTGSNVLSRMDVSGTIDASKIVVGTSREKGRDASFAAKLSDDKIDGEWECPSLNDHGVWFGTVKERKPRERVDSGQ